MTELSLPLPLPLPLNALSVEGAVGNTPVLWVDEPFATAPNGFWAKLEGFNPGGIKDRAALYMVNRSRERGDLLPGAPIVESTSGTLGLGLALAGVLLGHPVHLVTDPGMEPIMERMLTAHGATLYVVDRPHPDGGWQEARRRKVAALLAAYPGAWCPDQYHNPDNVAAYGGLADELALPAAPHRRARVRGRHRRPLRRGRPWPACAHARAAAGRGRHHRVHDLRPALPGPG